MNELQKLLELVSLLEEKQESTEVPFNVGDKVFIRTVTYHATGRVEKVVGNFLILSDAAWIADSGRFHNALKTGELSEVEPIPDGKAIIALTAIVDAFNWAHQLPREVR